MGWDGMDGMVIKLSQQSQNGRTKFPLILLYAVFPGKLLGIKANVKSLHVFSLKTWGVYRGMALEDGFCGLYGARATNPQYFGLLDRGICGADGETRS